MREIDNIQIRVLNSDGNEIARKDIYVQLPSIPEISDIVRLDLNKRYIVTGREFDLCIGCLVLTVVED